MSDEIVPSSQELFQAAFALARLPKEEADVIWNQLFDHLAGDFSPELTAVPGHNRSLGLYTQLICHFAALFWKR